MDGGLQQPIDTDTSFGKSSDDVESGKGKKPWGSQWLIVIYHFNNSQILNRKKCQRHWRSHDGTGIATGRGWRQWD